MKKFYITTAIAYPNGVPHLGHALEIVQADALARFYKLLGKDVLFQTGTDEHGIKNWSTAKKEGKEILEFLDANVKIFKKLYEKLQISYNYFIRTSDKKIHYPGAQKLWKELVKKNDIYKKKYKGLYCVGCESFKTEKELIEGQCPNHPTRKIEEIEEENYFFKLSKYAKQISSSISKDEYKVVPTTRKNEILSFLKEAKDISFSRPKTTLPWGVPVPDDEKHIMYVWCDALSNYITGQGYGRDNNFNKIWPADIHIIGKDILRFHAAFWPAMLLSANLQLPKELFVHGFLKTSGQKMGKSTGNVVDPLEQIEIYGVDQFRFYLLGCMPIDSDGEYSDDQIIERINNELVSNISNFCYRSLSFTNKNLNSKIGKMPNEPIVKEFTEKFNNVKKELEKRRFKQALAEILEISALGNKFLQEKEPWKNKEKSEEILTVCINIVKNISILLNPFLPLFSEKIQEQLKLKDLKWKDLGFDLEDHEIGEAEILIRKVEKAVKKEPDFSKLNIKVAKVLSIEDHPDADRLYVLQIDLGNEKRQLVAGLREYYKKEEILGKNIIVVTNLKYTKLKGVESQGMLLAATSKKKEVILITISKSAPGDQVKIESVEPSTKEITIKGFFTIPLLVKDKKVTYKGNILKTSKEDISVDSADGSTVG